MDQFNEAAFEKLYLEHLCGADAVQENDPFSESISDHGLLDYLPRDMNPKPEVYVAQKDYGLSKVALQEEFNLLGMGEALLAMLEASPYSEERRGVLGREIQVANLFIRDGLRSEIPDVQAVTYPEVWAAIHGTPLPSFRSFWPRIVEVKDHILSLLDRAGVRANHRTLKAALTAFEDSHRTYGKDQIGDIQRFMNEEIESLQTDLASAFNAIPALAPYASRFRRDKYRLNPLPEMRFDAGFSYEGGKDEQGPTLAGLLEWNAGRPDTEAGARYICRHEATHLHEAGILDLQHRDGLHGFEATLFTMSTCRAALSEGIAQAMPEILYGGIQGVVEARGIPFALAMLVDRLQDMVRIMVGLGDNEFADLLPDANQRREYLRNFVVNEMLQTEHIGDKYAGSKKKVLFWMRTVPGQLYGQCYDLGSTTLRQALAMHGPRRVLEVAFHTEQVEDIHSARKKWGL